MNEQVEAYINSMIPINISKKDCKLIRDEFASHIYDRIDFFIEIGYDKQASINKAIEEFGSKKEVRESIKNQLNDVYNEPLWLSFIAAAVTLVVNAVAILTIPDLSDLFGTPQGMNETIPMLLGSFTGTFIIFLMAVTAYKNGHKKVLLSLGITHVAIAIFHPFHLVLPSACAQQVIYTNFCYLIDCFTPISMKDYFEYYTGKDYIVICVIFTLLCFVGAFKTIKCGTLGKKRKISTSAFCSVFIAFAIFTTVLAVPAFKYVYYYPVFFKYSDGTTEETQMLYEKSIAQPTLNKRIKC